MAEIRPQLEKILAAKPQKIVLSAIRDKGQTYHKAVFVKKGNDWQAERFTATQAFHAKVKEIEILPLLETALQAEFSQLTAWTEDSEYSLRVTRKGQVLSNRRAQAGAVKPPAAAHDRQKNHLLAQSGHVEALRDMGLFTAQGEVAAPMRGKYRQINRFLEQVDDAVKQWPKKALHIIDFGCGESYLTFVLYHYLTQLRGIDARITGLDLKADVVKKCNAAAQKYGYANLHFLEGNIEEYVPAGPVDMVITLHACDTATDYALAGAVRWGTEMIFSVPCCQHELNGQIVSEEFSILTRYGILKERAAALFTDAIRANLLTACGYKTQVLEFVDFAHTPKNLLLRAVRRPLPAAKRQEALQEAERLIKAFALSPTLHTLLRA